MWRPGPSWSRQLPASGKRCFGIEQVGLHDDFFELGGHSLLATQLLNRLHQHDHRIGLSLADVFKHPTVAGLAQCIETADCKQVSRETQLTAEHLLQATSADRLGKEGEDLTTAIDSMDPHEAQTWLTKLDQLSGAQVDALLNKLEGGER